MIHGIFPVFISFFAISIKKNSTSLVHKWNLSLLASSSWLICWKRAEKNWKASRERVEEAIKWCSAWNYRLWRNEKSLSFQFPFWCLLAIDPFTFWGGSFWVNQFLSTGKSSPSRWRKNKSLSTNKGYLDRVKKCSDVIEKKCAITWDLVNLWGKVSPWLMSTKTRTKMPKRMIICRSNYYNCAEFIWDFERDVMNFSQIRRWKAEEFGTIW